MATRPRVSIAYTAIIFTGLALAVFGAIAAVLGLGGVSAFDGTIGSAKIKTSNVGLAILVVGTLLAGVVALKLPKDVRVFARVKPSFTERLAEIVAVPSLLIAALGTIAFVILLFVGKE
ncbi:MAG TPA: hypothetical protein VHX65_12775 [Pirellulales bacterium]|jgi:hypothetical protein|nr:hypothetical protein [Pirellulales bacterium]